MDKSDIIILIGILLLILGALDALQTLQPWVSRKAASPLPVTKTVSITETTTITETIAGTTTSRSPVEGFQGLSGNTSTPCGWQTGAPPLHVVEYNLTKHYYVLDMEGTKILLMHTVIPIIYFNNNTTRYQYLVAITLDVGNASMRTGAVLNRIAIWKLKLQLYGLNQTVNVTLSNIYPRITEPGFIKAGRNVYITLVPPLGYVVALNLTGLLSWHGDSTAGQNLSELARLVDLQVDMEYILEFSIVECNAMGPAYSFGCLRTNYTIPYSANISISYRGCIGLYVTYNEYWDSYVEQRYPVVTDINYIIPVRSGESPACPTSIYVIDYLPYHLLYVYYLAGEAEG